MITFNICMRRQKKCNGKMGSAFKYTGEKQLEY